MVCFHINQITQEVNDTLDKIGDHKSTLYRELSSIVKAENIKPWVEVTKKGFLGGEDYAARTNYKTFDFHYIPEEVLAEIFNKINRWLSECDCYKENKNRQIKNQRKVPVTYSSRGGLVPKHLKEWETEE